MNGLPASSVEVDAIADARHVAEPAGGEVPAAAYVFAPATLKLAAMFVTTFGAYGTYWFYRNWIAVRQLTGQAGIWPVWRAAFSPIWVFACFQRLCSITGDLRGGRVATFSLAAAFLLLTILCVGNGTGWLAVLTAWIPLAVVNARLRRFKRAQGIPPARREGFTMLSMAWLGTGGLLMGLTLLAVLLLGPLLGSG